MRIYRCFLELLIIALLALGTLCAQEISISGCVLDATDSVALTGASVSVLDGEGTLMGGTTTGSEGEFSLLTRLAESAKVRITFVGYSPIVIEIAGSTRGDISLGTLYMTEDSELLGEVVVQGQTNQIDKMLVFPKPEELSRSYDIFSLLQTMNLRGLNVNTMNKSASAYGKDVQWQIDGVPRTLQEIRNVDPERILRIEYSDLLSSRYTDQGVGAIINVILKERQRGGSVWTQLESALTTKFVDGSVGARYDMGQHSFTLDYLISYRDYEKKRTYTEEKYITPGLELNRTEQPEDSPMGYVYQNINFTYLYQPSDQRLFSTTFRNVIINRHETFFSEILQTGQSPFSQQKGMKDRSYTPSLDLYYTRLFDDGGKLEINLVGSHNRGDYEFELQDRRQDIDLAVKNDVDVKRTAIIGEVAYKHPFSQHLILSTGLQHTTAYSLNKYLEETDDLWENNSYLFANVQGQWGKLQYSVGTGAKLFVVKDARNQRVFARNKSALSVAYSPIPNLSIVLNSTYAPSLPSLSNLSTIRQRKSDLVVTGGNPNLKAAEALNNRFGVYYQSRLLSSAVDLFLINIWNPFFSDATYDETGGYFLSRAINGKYNRQYGVSWQGGLNNLWSFLTLQGTVRYSRYQSDTGSDVHKLNGIYWDISAMMHYRGWTLSYTYTHPDWMLYGNIKSKGENYSSISLLYKYKDWSFHMSCHFPFTQYGAEYHWEILSSVMPSVNKAYILDNRNMLAVGVSWRMNFGKQLNIIARTLENKDTNQSVVK